MRGQLLGTCSSYGLSPASSARIINGWISISGCFGGEGVCLGNSLSVLRKQTFGKVKCHGRSPVLLIQLEDSRHRFTLLERFECLVVRDSATIRGVKNTQ